MARSLQTWIGGIGLARGLRPFGAALACGLVMGFVAGVARAQQGAADQAAPDQTAEETPPPFEGQFASPPDWRDLAIRMQPNVAHMGMIKADGEKTREFLLFNEGDEPITFRRVRTTCGCVNGEVTTEPVEPGDAATFTIHWTDLQGLNGEQHRRLFLFHDQGGPPIMIPVSVGIWGGQDVEDHLEERRAQAALPKVEMRPEKLDFGLMRPRETRTETVLLTNAGNEPIRFTNVTSTCGCAKGSVEQNTINPGESARLDVTLEARENVGPLNQKLTVFIEDSPKRIPVELTAEVTKPIKADPFFLNLLGPKEGEIKLTAVDGAPFKVLSIDGEPAEGSLSQLRPSHTVPWDLSETAPEDLRLWYMIETDHPEMPLIDLRVVHPALFPKMNQGSHWTATPDRLVLGTLSAGESRTETLSLVKQRRDVPVEVESTKGLFDVRVVEISPGDRDLRVTLSLTPTSKAAEQGGLIRGALIVKTANPEQEATIPVFGVFRDK